MKTRLSVSRCCCEDQPVGLCPCISGTLTLGGNIIVSGFLRYKSTWANVNGSTLIDSFGFRLCALQGGRTLPGVVDSNMVVTIQFTRLESLDVFSAFGNLILPPGVKAVITVGQFTQRIPPVNNRAVSTAYFHMVVDTDPNENIDCEVGLSGFTFNRQDQNLLPQDEPAFDASAGAVIYDR